MVAAVTVSPEYRRLGVASKLMAHLEEVSQDLYNAYFVDLFVRVSNNLAQVMYCALQYSTYRQVSWACSSIVSACSTVYAWSLTLGVVQVLKYYSGEEDAYDMRKALRRDAMRESVVPLKKPITPDELEW